MILLNSLARFSRILPLSHVVTSNFDCFVLFLIGQSNFFGFGFTTLNWKWKLLPKNISRDKCSIKELPRKTSTYLVIIKSPWLAHTLLHFKTFNSDSLFPFSPLKPTLIPLIPLELFQGKQRVFVFFFCFFITRILFHVCSIFFSYFPVTVFRNRFLDI